MEKVIDGNEAVAYISYAYSEAASLFPITPSSPMGEWVEKWSSDSLNNCWHQVVKNITMESETGVAGSMHGLLRTGILATSYSCSQGLLLMIPTLYKMVGELLPAVIHVSARSVATSALNIYGDHSDVMATRQTGAVLLVSGTVQEAALFSAVAHLAAQKGRLPVIHFFDGFQTSHELRKIELPSYDTLFSLVDDEAVALFKRSGLSNFNPKQTGTVQDSELFFQQREAANIFYLAMERIVEQLLEKLNPIFQTDCSTVEYFGSEDAETVVVLMGAVQETAKQVVKERVKTGVIVIHLYRPFPQQRFIDCLPKSVKSIAVLDRTKEPGSTGEPLLLDVQQTCQQYGRQIEVIGGRYGLGGKETEPKHIHAVFSELEKSIKKQQFTVGIEDDMTQLSLKTEEREMHSDETDFRIKIWGFGSDGSVSGAKDFIRIIGQQTTQDVQARFFYSSAKSRGLTVAHLRIDHKKIAVNHPIYTPNIVVCNQFECLRMYDVVQEIEAGGMLLINTNYGVEELAEKLTGDVLNHLQTKRVTCYILPASTIARKYQLGPKINLLMIANLFSLTEFIPTNQALQAYQTILLQHPYMRDQAYREASFAAIKESMAQIKKVIFQGVKTHVDKSSFEEKTGIDQLIARVNQLNGEAISTGSVLANGLADGSFPLGLGHQRHSPRSATLPCWNSEACLQCQLCSLVCPHAAIRPCLFTEDETDHSTVYRKNKDYQYQLVIDPEKCTGCSLCEDICPAKGNALQMQEASDQVIEREQERWRYAIEHNDNKQLSELLTADHDLAFREPLLAFSGACAGCGETPYVKLLTQLFGERLVIANATGCSSIWGGTAPYTPFYQNNQGDGPTWSNSLFENNSSFGLGMKVGQKLLRQQAYQLLTEISQNECYSLEVRELIQRVVAEEGEINQTIRELVKYCKQSSDSVLRKVIDYQGSLLKQTHWLIGGDGWAYDIDFGGINHLLSSGENINILILDNEGFSNTGGQMSKGTPLAAKMKLASHGNRQDKKDFGYYALQHEDVYVAQISVFASPNQTIKALQEAESYPGVSVVIAYSPCITHKLKESPIATSKAAVECGYWPLYRYYPGREQPMSLDSSYPDWSKFLQFLSLDGRFDHLDADSPIKQELISKAQKRYVNYQLFEQLSTIQ
ncbi:pyruvate:ferredoxin (flavodoxin) oxidoreductase [Amphibacillus sp. Q70]|uniref:pyruvate:ferredoxin (flavodoxin) oxidoreductase n=1 Tax=Amphibacillus sp. Q70 TaxID=3453416 RepID=UPI003F86F888